MVVCAECEMKLTQCFFTVLLVRWSEGVKSLPHPSWPDVVVPRNPIICGSETQNDVVDVFVFLLLHQTCYYAYQVCSTGKNLLVLDFLSNMPIYASNGTNLYKSVIAAADKAFKSFKTVWQPALPLNRHLMIWHSVLSI